MRRLILSLLLGSLLSLNLGCQEQEDPAAPPTPEVQDSTAPETTPAKEEHPSITAANKVLAAIHTGDSAAIRLLLNATNQTLRDDELPQLLKEAKEFVGEATEVTEVRKRARENQVAAKLRVVEERVLVIVLTLEDGKYLFEDLNSPDVAHYEALEKITP